MASRAEEKELRRQERLRAEQEAAAGAKRLRMVQIGVGALLAVAIVVGVVIALTSGGGSDRPAKQASSSGQNAIPAPTAAADPKNLAASAKAAGCTWKQ